MERRDEMRLLRRLAALFLYRRARWPTMRFELGELAEIPTWDSRLIPQGPARPSGSYRGLLSSVSADQARTVTASLLHGRPKFTEFGTRTHTCESEDTAQWFPQVGKSAAVSVVVMTDSSSR